MIMKAVLERKAGENVDVRLSAVLPSLLFAIATDALCTQAGKGMSKGQASESVSCLL